MESWILAGLFYMLVLFAYFLAGARVGISMATVGILALYVVAGSRFFGDIGAACFHTFNSFTFVAIPLFLLMGQFLMRGNLMDRIYTGINYWAYHIPGGLLITNILSCSLFAAISGSSAATAATIGQIAIPELRRRRCVPSEIYGSIAGGGTLGILIPPSINMIVYGSVTDQSVGKLFMGGVIPGIIAGAMFCFFIMIRAILKPPIVDKEMGEIVSYTWKDRISSLPILIPVALLILGIMGTIYSGIGTATEAAGVGALGALIIGIFYGGISFEYIKKSLIAAAGSFTWISFIVLGAVILGFGLSRHGITQSFAGWIISLKLGQIGTVLMIMGVYIILGCFIESISMMLLTMPIFIPVLQALGVDLIWFGILITIQMELAMITPPVGICLFITKGIAGDPPMREVVQGSIPYAIMLELVLLLVIAFPSLATWLPSHIIG